MPVASSRVSGLCALLLVLLCFLLANGFALAADPQAAGTRLPPVAVDTLRAKIKEAADYTEIDEAARNKLIERYRKTLSFLETAEANQATTDTYRKSRKTAPEEAGKLRDKLEAVLKTGAEIEIKVTDTSPLEAINQELISEKAKLAAVSAKLTQTESELSTQVERPSKARNRIGEIKRRLEELAASGQTPAPEGESGRDAEARNWLLEAEKYTLDTEIIMLDQDTGACNPAGDTAERQAGGRSRTGQERGQGGEARCRGQASLAATTGPTEYRTRRGNRCHGKCARQGQCRGR